MFANGGIRVERLNLHLERFGREFDGLKIVQLSDLHVTRFARRERQLIDLVNREAPHFICITGDLVANYSNDFAALIRVIGGLSVRHAIFSVLGNADHTFRPKGHFDDFMSALRNASVTVLVNSNVSLLYRGNKIALAGVDDPFFLFDDFDEAVRGVSFDHPTILLSHSPDILFKRGDALVVNLLDSGLKEDFFKTWGWATTTYFGPESGEFFFERDGKHTVRIQSRQDGVSLDTLLLNPYPELDERLSSKQVEEIDDFLRARCVPDKYSGLVVIHTSMAEQQRCHGKWKKSSDGGALLGHRLDDLPARRSWRYQPLAKPVDYFEVDFEARANVRYRLWMRMKAFNGNPLTDSVYVQFSDALDKSGRRRYRIGMPAHMKARLNDVDLILTGHTHGGQIRFPFYGAVETMTALGRQYAAGLYRVGRSALYVSRGVGCSALPIRFLCPPEVTVFSFGT
jgi:predicted MPP superfamily phosphohydrolase